MTAPTVDRSWTREALVREAEQFLAVLGDCPDLETARARLIAEVHRLRLNTYRDEGSRPWHDLAVVRDCSRAFTGMLLKRSEDLAGFSVTQALWDVASGRPRDDLRPGFFAEMIYLVRGLEGRGTIECLGDEHRDPTLEGREAARARSDELDRIWASVEAWMARYPDGLSDEARDRRAARRRRVLGTLGGTEADWADWQWQVRRVVTEAETLGRLADLSEDEVRAIRDARGARLPFGVTPYYASLLDDEPSGRDRAIRAQVFPPPCYVAEMAAYRGDHARWCDFMRETDTSPIDRITRRYPAVVVLKPYNTCPQICVYCQRNWEIEQTMDPAARAPAAEIDAALRWIADHPAVHEVLVTGGDPMVLEDAQIGDLLARLARIPHVDLVRIGTRTPVTLPMRITDDLAALLGRFRGPGRREIAVVTHVEHPYEVTPEMVAAVDRLRRQGIAVYNQQVYTFFVSRRFESARLRMLLRRVGIDPYYTFAPKGKQETAAYRVPLARLLQERKEEVRLLPGLRRTDESVFNVPGLGKTHLRAYQHRDLVSLLADGSRVYEFHPWEKYITSCETYLATDVPILDYLERLAAAGEDPKDYESIWYYY